MKKKKFTRKLSLKKTTISNLSSQEMEVAEGGGTYYTCASVCTCYPVCTIYRTNCNSCAPCESVDTGCYPNCTAFPCPN